MAISAQIITLAIESSGAGFTISGVFWLTAPANFVQPLPTFHSQVPGVANADLAQLRAGTAVEQPFVSTTVFASGATQATIDAALQTQFTTEQNTLNALAAEAPATVVPRAFNGATWAAASLSGLALPIAGAFFVPVQSPLTEAASLGLLPGIVTGRATGYVVNATATFAKIRATAYSPALPGAAAQRSVSSSSASDAAAGVGARSITLTYLTTAFTVKQETVILNGVAPVNTVNVDIAYIESMVVATSGSSLTNVGTITLFNATAGGGGALGSIAPNDAQTFWAHHYVPAGKTCYLVNVSFGDLLVAGVGILNRTGDPSQTTLPTISIGGQYPHAAGGAFDHLFECPLAVPGPDLIVLSDKPNAATANNVGYGTFEYFQM